jgi:hypothetical protein
VAAQRAHEGGLLLGAAREPASPRASSVPSRTSESAPALVTASTSSMNWSTRASPSELAASSSPRREGLPFTMAARALMVAKVRFRSLTAPAMLRSIRDMRRRRSSVSLWMATSSLVARSTWWMKVSRSRRRSSTSRTSTSGACASARAASRGSHSVMLSRVKLAVPPSWAVSCLIQRRSSSSTARLEGSSSHGNSIPTRSASMRTRSATQPSVCTAAARSMTKQSTLRRRPPSTSTIAVGTRLSTRRRTEPSAYSSASFHARATTSSEVGCAAAGESTPP